MSSHSKISSTDEDSNRPIKEQKYIILDKLSTLKKENHKIEQENKMLKQELESLHNDMRLMIPGFSSNTSNSFPMLTELHNKISDYIKISCEDIFFDLLQPNLNMKGVVDFFKIIFLKLSDLVEKYFSPIEKAINNTLFIDQIYEPIDNVLRKSYQFNWKNFYEDLKKGINCNEIISEINKKLKFDNLKENGEEWNMIKDFIIKTYEIIYFCYISDPIVSIDISQIGKEVKYNSMTHDSLDGFIKSKQVSTIILPTFYKGKVSTKNSMLVKSQVLAKDYEFN
jgi:hypothetical protein